MCQLVRASCLTCVRVGERRECVRAFTKDVDGTRYVMVAQMDCFVDCGDCQSLYPGRLQVSRHMYAAVAVSTPPPHHHV